MFFTSVFLRLIWSCIFSKEFLDLLFSKRLMIFFTVICETLQVIFRCYAKYHFYCTPSWYCSILVAVRVSVVGQGIRGTTFIFKLKTHFAYRIHIFYTAWAKNEDEGIYQIANNFRLWVCNFLSLMPYYVGLRKRSLVCQGICKKSMEFVCPFPQQVELIPKITVVQHMLLNYIS